MNKETIIKELHFKAVKSSGAGGQHVNKTSSKVELSFDIKNSNAISIEEKELVLSNLKNRLTKENVLILTSSESRSQHKNKELVIKRLFQLLTASLIPKKKRKATKPSKASILKKAEHKRRQALKKTLRKKPRID